MHRADCDFIQANGANPSHCRVSETNNVENEEALNGD